MKCNMDDYINISLIDTSDTKFHDSFIQSIYKNFDWQFCYATACFKASTKVLSNWAVETLGD
jgi:hypothetical protein